MIFTTDHGELQGDFGLLFKGPYHVDALMRLPLVWRPAPNAAVPAAEVTRPVGHLDLASTFPVTPVFPAFCVMSYTELKYRAPIVTRGWGGSNVPGSDVTVTFQSYEGGRLTGTFHGTLTSQDVPPNPPVTVDGQFSVDLGS